MNRRSVLNGILLCLCFFSLSACGMKKEEAKESIMDPEVESVQAEIEKVSEIEEEVITEEIPEEITHKEIPKEYYYYASLLTNILDNPSWHVNVLYDEGVYYPGTAEFAIADIDSDSEQELLIKSKVTGYVEDVRWDGISVYKYSNNWGIEPNYQYVGDVTFYNDDSVLISFADLYTKNDEGMLVESDLVDVEFYEMSNLVESFTTGTGALSVEEGETLIRELTEGKQKVELTWEIISQESILKVINADLANSAFLDDKYDLTNYIRFMNRGRNTEEEYSYKVDMFVENCIYQGIVNDNCSMDGFLQDMLPSIRVSNEVDYATYQVNFEELNVLADKLYRIEPLTEEDLNNEWWKKISESVVEGYCELRGNGYSYKLQLLDYYEENENIIIKGICHLYDEGILSDYFECTLHETCNGILNGYEVIDFVSEPLWKNLI